MNIASLSRDEKSVLLALMNEKYRGGRRSVAGISNETGIEADDVSQALANMRSSINHEWRSTKYALNSALSALRLPLTLDAIRNGSEFPIVTATARPSDSNTSPPGEDTADEDGPAPVTVEMISLNPEQKAVVLATFSNPRFTKRSVPGIASETNLSETSVAAVLGEIDFLFSTSASENNTKYGLRNVPNISFLKTLLLHDAIVFGGETNIVVGKNPFVPTQRVVEATEEQDDTSEDEGSWNPDTSEGDVEDDDDE